MNYRSFYGQPTWADAEALTPKQYRRGARKTERDFLAGRVRGNPTSPKGLSGHPGRRRAQIEGRAS